MRQILRVILSAVAVCVLGGAVYGQDLSREQVKGVDEQIQAIKSDVLSIAAELNQLEEKLLFPSQTQVSLFLSLSDGERFRLDSVDIQLDGAPVAHHLYSFKELEALQMGGVQRIFTGNAEPGEHALLVNFDGKSEDGDVLKHSASFRIQKGTGPGIYEISVAAQGITLNDR